MDAQLPNGGSLPLAAIPSRELHAFRRELAESLAADEQLAAFFVAQLPEGSHLLAILGASGGMCRVLATPTPPSFASLTPTHPQIHWFERELAELGQLTIEGHPHLRPIRSDRSQEAPYYRLTSTEVHEVAVGPVHAGVIEPGHFRFQCHGEEVLHLEIRLGYQHRGIERRLRGGPDRRALSYAETLAGDTSVGHATAHCMAREALAGTELSARAEVLRAVALELERLANHVGDLGAIAGDVGYLPVAAFCGRLRGDLLNLTLEWCGNRFGRGLIRPGGVGFDLDAALVERLRERLAVAGRDVEGALDLMLAAPSVQARLAGTGRLESETARELGLVGPAARASGLARDVRQDWPWGAYCAWQVPVATWQTGTAFGRAWVRIAEVRHSLDLVDRMLSSLPHGDVRVASSSMRPHHLAISLVEGWRGAIAHVAVTDAEGGFAAYKVVDPSFHNWMGLAVAMRGQAISDFPLCNKSFNLSYCGHDL